MNPLILKALTEDKYLSEGYESDLKNPDFGNKSHVHLSVAYGVIILMMRLKDFGIY